MCVYYMPMLGMFVFRFYLSLCHFILISIYALHIMICLTLSLLSRICSLDRSYASVVHMGIGNAGVTPLDAVGNSTNTPSWVAYQASEYGYASMRINAKELEIYFHNNQTDIRFSSLLKRDSTS